MVCVINSRIASRTVAAMFASCRFAGHADYRTHRRSGGFLTFPRLEGLSWPRPRKEERVNGPDRYHRPCGESHRRGREDDSLLRRDRGITDPNPGGIGLSTVR